MDADDPPGTYQDVHTLLRVSGILGYGTEQAPTGAPITAATLTVETTNQDDGASLHRMLVDSTRRSVGGSTAPTRHPEQRDRA